MGVGNYDDNRGESYCDYEGFKVAIEARGNAPPVFEAAEHAFDDVALLVDGLVVIILGFVEASGKPNA